MGKGLGLGLRSFAFAWNGANAAGFSSIIADLTLCRKCPGDLVATSGLYCNVITFM